MRSASMPLRMGLVVAALFSSACCSARSEVAADPALSAGPALLPDAGLSEDAPCTRDDECGFTRIEAGGCCAALCTPRVVTRARAAQLDANLATCAKGRRCPNPECAPPRSSLIPKCQSGRCVGVPVRNDRD